MAATKILKTYTPKQIIDNEALSALANVTDWQRKTTEELKSDYEDLDKLRHKDITDRLKSRQNFARFLMALLVAQNIVVFAIFVLGMWLGKIAGLENLFSILIGGTLAETTSLIYIIVKFLFSDIPYQGNNSGTNNSARNPIS